MILKTLLTRSLFLIALVTGSLTSLSQNCDTTFSDDELLRLAEIVGVYDSLLALVEHQDSLVAHLDNIIKRKQNYIGVLHEQMQILYNERRRRDKWDRRKRVVNTFAWFFTGYHILNK
jgi:hypothetical protein